MGVFTRPSPVGCRGGRKAVLLQKEMRVLVVAVGMQEFA